MTDVLMLSDELIAGISNTEADQERGGAEGCNHLSEWVTTSAEVIKCNDNGTVYYI